MAIRKSVDKHWVEIDLEKCPKDEILSKIKEELDKFEFPDDAILAFGRFTGFVNSNFRSIETDEQTKEI